MASDPKVPEVMEWGQDDGEQGGNLLSRTTAPTVETMVTQTARAQSVDQTPRSPVGLGLPAKYGKPRRAGSRHNTEPTRDPIIRICIERLSRILGRFDPELTKSQDTQHLSYCSLPTNVLLMAQELAKVKDQVKSVVHIVGREHA